MAKSHWIGKKEGGVWTFTETEIRKLSEEREAHQKAIKLRKRAENQMRRLKGLPPKRKKKKKRPARDYDDDVAPRRGRRRPATIDDVPDRMSDPLVQLDMAVARQRAIEQQFTLPFVAPASTRYGLLHCPTCGRPALLIIDCDNAIDEAGIGGYERLTADIITQYRLPTVLCMLPDLPPENPASRMMFRLVWPDQQRPPEMRIVTQPEWYELVNEISGQHCSPGDQTT